MLNSGHYLSRYSNNIESEENVRIIILLKRCHNNKHFAQLAPQHGEKTKKTAGNRYGVKKLRHVTHV